MYAGVTAGIVAVAATVLLRGCPDTGDLNKLGTEHKEVCRREFTCVRADFMKHFDLKSGGTVYKFDADSTRQTMDWSDLKDLADSVKTDDLGIRIHYGSRLNGNRAALVWALEPVELVPVDDVFYEVAEKGDSLVLVSPNGKVRTLIHRKDWTDGPLKHYLDNIRVKRTNSGSFRSIRADYDHQSYTFRWSDIADLQDQNSATRLRINAISTPMTRAKEGTTWVEEDWRHEVALTALGNDDVDTIDDATYGASNLKAKALDLGSPCPPSCLLARYYRVGLAPEDTCDCHP